MSIEKLTDKFNNKQYLQKINDQLLAVESAEVFDIILDSKHESYENEYSIGTITFKRLVTDKQSGAEEYYTATPLNPGQTQYPLKHEVVLIVSAPNPSSGIVEASTSYYYTDIVNVWGRVNHNPIPYSTTPLAVKESKDLDKSYSNFTGNMNSNSTEIELGEYFPDNIKIPKLMPYEGDTIFEGRFGTSIRFGATYLKTKNNWSSQGTDGDPIVIIRTDKKSSNKIYTEENINEDASSIYICDGQLISLEPAYSDLKSFQTKPSSPTNYNEKQIIVNSGRLFFNATVENIFLSAKKSISIAASETVNIDFGDKITIGNQSSAQKIARGNDLMDLLNNLVFPSPMGPIPFNSALVQPPFKGQATWATAHSTDTPLSDKSYIE